MKKLFQNKGCKKLVCMLVMFSLMINTFILCPKKAQAESQARFRVRVSYTVYNEHDGDENKIRIYYWTPNSNGYEYKEEYKTISYSAKKKGQQYADVEIPGPVQSVAVFVHGSTTDNVEYYVKKIEQTTLDPVEGSKKEEKYTLWEGVVGCEVATFGSNTIYNRLFFNKCADIPKGSKYPYFQGWRDPGTEWNAAFGDNKQAKTDSYFSDACLEPATAGMVGFKIKSPTEISVPTEKEANYPVVFDQGVVYDRFGAAWPKQTVDSITLSRSDGFNYNKDSNELRVSCKANAADDYYLEVSQNSSGQTGKDKILIHTWDYMFTFLDEKGNQLGTQTVEYGKSVDLPQNEENQYCLWSCDEYADWTKTNDGPQKRTVHRVALYGAGTEDNPIQIHSAEEWHYLNDFSNRLNGLAGKYVRLENDISVSEIIGSQNNPFSGHFDGNGHTITADINNNNDEYRAALFSYVKNASISNLIVDGNITGDKNRAAGLIGENSGETHIDNCVVSASIAGKELVGGFVIGAGNKLIIEDSKFIGKINAANNSGGFVAYGSNGTTIRNCQFLAKEGSSTGSGATFVQGNYEKIIDCIFDTPFGNPQGVKLDRSTQYDADVQKEAINNLRSVTAAKNLQVKSFKASLKTGGISSVTWKKLKEAVRFEVEYGTDKLLAKNVKRKTIIPPIKKLTLKKLKKGKTYYARIRAYVEVVDGITGNKKTYSTKWSAILKFKIKKS